MITAMNSFTLYFIQSPSQCRKKETKWVMIRKEDTLLMLLQMMIRAAHLKNPNTLLKEMRDFSKTGQQENSVTFYMQ